MKISIKKIFITLGILTTICGIYFALIPALLSSNYVQSKFQSIIKTNYGFELTLENYKLRTCITPHIKIKAKNIEFNNYNSDNHLKLKNFNAKINIFSAILGQPNISKLDVDEINLELKTEYSEKIFSKKIINLIKHTNLKNTNIHNITIDIQNQKLIKDINISGSDIKIDKFNLQKRIKANLALFFKDNIQDGNLKLISDIHLPITPKNVQKSTTLIDIEKLNLDTFSKITSKLYPKLDKLNGTITLNLNKDLEDFFTLNLLTENLNIKYANYDTPAKHTKPLEVKTIISVNEEKITINSLKILSEAFKSSIFGTINIKEKNDQDLNLSISLDKSNLQEILNLIPPEDLIPELNFYALKKYPINGDVLAHLEVTGKAIRPQINGNILMKDVFVIHPIKNAKKATIKLIFNRDKMTLATNIPTAPKERVWADGTFNLYDEKYCTLKVKSTKKINLETAQTILNPLQEIIKIDFGPLPIMKVQGQGNIDLNVSGNTTSPHLTGLFNFENAQVSFNDIPNLIIKNGGGELIFQDTDTYFNTYEATLNSSPLTINGECDVYGKFNFHAETKKQNLNKLLADIKGNTILTELNKNINQIEHIKGFGDLNINIFGDIKNINDIQFNKNIFTKGAINLTAVSLKYKDIPQTISNIFGEIGIENQDLIMDLYALLNKSKIIIEGKIKDAHANLIVKTKDFRIIDGIATLPLETQRNILTLIKSNEIISILPTINTSFTARYKGDISTIQPQNLEVYGTLYSPTRPEFRKSTYELVNSTLKYTPIKTTSKDLKINTVGTFTNIFDADNRNFTGEFNLYDFNLALLNVDIIKQIPQLKNITTNLSQLEGIININSNIINNNINANCDIKNMKLLGKKYTHEILNGKLQIKNNILHTNAINARFFDMPILLNGKISLFNPADTSYSFNINTKPTQDFINYFYNQNALYPIKTKGDLTLNAQITGNKKQANVKSDLLLGKDSSIYYMGATLGDKANEVNLSSNITFKENGIKINNFNYDKIILSLDKNKTIIPLLNINGSMNYAPNNLILFDNLKIKSKMPVDAKIFNIIFRKPFMKQGVFTSDLTLNGSSLKPYFLGKLNITDINIPLVETNINNINFDFTPRFINLTSSGDLLTNKTQLNATLKNNLSLPLQVENMNINVAQLDLNKINEKIRHIEENNFKIHTTSTTFQPLDYTNFIINNATISAKTILIDEITASNYKSNIEIGTDKILKVKNFDFDMAEGKVNGSITHNYKNNDVTINLNLNKANAEQIAQSLFKIKGQIFGLANGKMALSCNAQTDKTCLATLNGSGNFEIQNGKMPKLGSLEYLLKAGNLINNGFSGLTISGLIDLLSPLKSGEFKTISGDFKLNNGIAEDINIYSSGKDLNLYITGKYNLSNSIADFKMFGSISKDVTTLFNKVKNLSLNTLLKTIPGIKGDTKTTFINEISKIPNSNEINNIYKFFRVIINGDINGEHFVKAFEWIE